MREGKKMNEKKTNKKILIIFLLIILAIVLIIGGTYAYFTTRIDDNVSGNVGKADVELEEEFPNTGNENGEDAVRKIVRGHSIAEKRVYVRLKCLPILEFLHEFEEDGEAKAEWRTTSVSLEDIELKYTGSDWIEQDGYYYYNKILNQNDYTTDLQIDWKLNQIPDQFVDKDVRLNVKVILEYAQSSNDAWKDIFEIDRLPDGVEESE